MAGNIQESPTPASREEHGEILGGDVGKLLGFWFNPKNIGRVFYPSNMTDVIAWELINLAKRPGVEVVDASRDTRRQLILEARGLIVDVCELYREFQEGEQSSPRWFAAGEAFVGRPHAAEAFLQGEPVTQLTTAILGTAHLIRAAKGGVLPLDPDDQVVTEANVVRELHMRHRITSEEVDATDHLRTGLIFLVQAMRLGSKPTVVEPSPPGGH